MSSNNRSQADELAAFASAAAHIMDEHSPAAIPSDDIDPDAHASYVLDRLAQRAAATGWTPPTHEGTMG